MRAALALVWLAAAGCASAPAPADGPALRQGTAVGPLRLDGRAEVAGDSLRADLRVTNVGRRPVSVGYGACSATVLGWPDSLRLGPPAVTTAVERTVGGYGVGCPMYLAVRTLAPGQAIAAGDARELRLDAPLAEILTDSIPDGRYWLTAVFDVAETDGARSGETLRVDLGPHVLAARRPALAAEALRAGARFAVDSVRVEGGRVRAVVRAVPVPRMGPDVVGWAPCAARVLAYAEVDRRDAAPRSGPPDAAAEAGCGQPAPTPFGGATPTREGPPLYLGIERTLRAEIDLALADLLGGQPAGRYALAVAVRTVRGPYDVRALPPVVLTLGEADWRP